MWWIASEIWIYQVKRQHTHKKEQYFLKTNYKLCHRSPYTCYIFFFLLSFETCIQLFGLIRGSRSSRSCQSPYQSCVINIVVVITEEKIEQDCEHSPTSWREQSNSDCVSSQLFTYMRLCNTAFTGIKL